MYMNNKYVEHHFRVIGIIKMGTTLEVDKGQDRD